MLAYTTNTWRWADAANVGPALNTMGQYCTSTSQTPRICWATAWRLVQLENNTATTPVWRIGGGCRPREGDATPIAAQGANAMQEPSVDLLLIHSPRRWPSIKTPLGQCRPKLVVNMRWSVNMIGYIGALLGRRPRLWTNLSPSSAVCITFTGNAKEGLGEISPYDASRLECCLNYDPMLYSVGQP